jgi:hypothetical protein
VDGRYVAPAEAGKPRTAARAGRIPETQAVPSTEREWHGSADAGHKKKHLLLVVVFAVTSAFEVPGGATTAQGRK